MTARAWLARELDARGESPARELLAAGSAAGHSERALRRARERLGIVARRVSIGGSGTGGWLWRAAGPKAPGPGVLPAERSEQRADGAPTRGALQSEQWSEFTDGTEGAPW